MRVEVLYTKDRERESPYQEYRMRGTLTTHPEKSKGEWIHLRDAEVSTNTGVQPEGWVLKADVIHILRLE